MVTCLLCGFDVELDDAVVVLASRARCICVRCFGRETGSTRPMPRWLQREVTACLHVDV